MHHHFIYYGLKPTLRLDPIARSQRDSPADRSASRTGELDEMILRIFSQSGDDFPRQSRMFSSPITLELFIRQIRFFKEQGHQFNHPTSFDNIVNHFGLGSISFVKSPLLNMGTRPRSFR